ncbi:hypothetical protein NXC14_PA00255 (plasmid) [Rhizobium sp. NXC14]|uniref:hypothetical protein n=1 Tax=Rhizobium sp. NXC14 TaxID=1981173 RepID=UPI000A2054F7|nr:hypothetical protein [Rhizobium sp. NXC14]ARO32529.1 hypothetical protein NXC14_PA00255 [Rhizobium sp. NXC14]
MAISIGSSASRYPDRKARPAPAESGTHNPRCGVDTPGHLYSYTFAGGDWSKFFPLEEEINDYFDRVAREFDIESFIRYGNECLLTPYDEDTRTWHSRLRRSDGNDRGRIVTNSPWRLIDHWKLTREADLCDYCTVTHVGFQTEASAEDIASTSGEAGEERRSGDELVGGGVQHSSQMVERNDAGSGAK